MISCRVSTEFVKNFIVYEFGIKKKYINVSDDDDNIILHIRMPEKELSEIIKTNPSIKSFVEFINNE
jgi:hypothetical protein